MTKTFLLVILVVFSACQKNITKDSAQQPPIVIVKSNQVVKSGEVKKGQGLFQALMDVEISNENALKITNVLRDEIEFSKLKVGDKLEATFNQKELVKFSFSQNPAELHVVNWDNTKKSWIYKFVEKETTWEQRLLKGKLKANSTLQQDLLELNLSPGVVNEVINILMCKVNFRRNARVGDEFELLLNERKYNSKIIETQIYYTSYKGSRAGNHESYYYDDGEKKSTYSAHYTRNGVALIKSALRYPLSHLHIRSGYGWRRHPVSGKRKFHRGIDLRGRVGKTVHAVADGKVIQSTYTSSGGNKIAIKHRDGSISYYLHLDKRKVNKGTYVKSYQVIGTVGATGQVTGPHLHFGFKSSNGKWINPLNKRMIATNKLKGKKLASLQKQIQKIKGLIAFVKSIKIAPYIAAKTKENELTIKKISPL